MTDRALNLAIAGLCSRTMAMRPANWKPTNNWKHVHDFVIPALQQAGGNVNLEYDDNSLHVTITPNDSDDWIVVRGIVGPRPSPRMFCELALEAWNKLEAGHGY